MAELTEAGCVGFSQAEVAADDTLVLHARAAVRRDLRLHGLAAAAGRLARQGRGRQGALATRMGLSGVPVAPRRSRCTRSSSWCATPARACTCAACQRRRRRAGAPAKAEGLPVTCDVSINSLHLTDVDIGYFNAAMRLTPPLRQQRDRDALRAGAGRRHDRRAGVRPHAGRRRRQEPAVRRGRARRHRARTAAEPGAEVGPGDSGLPLAHRSLAR
jgi:dihydroorotase